MEKILIAFDCFGVVLKRFSKELSTKYNLSDKFDEMIEAFDKADRNIITHSECMMILESITGINHKLIEEEFINLSLPIDDMINFISENKDKYHIVMISNATSFLNTIIDHYNIRHLFEKIYISSECNLYKPNESFYEYVLSEYKPIKAIMVDDKLENIIGAKNASMYGILYSNHNEFLKEIEEILVL